MTHASRQGLRLAGRGAVAGSFAPRRSGEHPDILAAAAALTRDDIHHAFGRNSGQPAGHHLIAGGGRDRIDAQGQRARRELHGGAGAPRGRLRQRHAFLRNIRVRPAAQPTNQRRALLASEVAAKAGFELLIRIGSFDDQLFQMRDHVVERRALTAPPGRDRRQAQRLSKQPLRRAGQKPLPGGRFEQAAAERVGEQHAAGAHGAEHAGHSERRVGAQLQWIAVIVVEPSQDCVHAPQSQQRLQINRIGSHREILPLHQGQPQLPREIRVLEIGFVERPRSEHHDQWRSAVVGELHEAFAQRIEEGGQRPDRELIDQTR